MSAKIVIPAGNKPTAVSVKTSSYTIPAGKYARVIVNLEGSATLTLNGTTALRGTQNSILGSSSLHTRSSTNTAAGFRTEIYQLSISPSNENYILGSAFSSSTDQKTVISEIFVPTGTVISGTGTWRAVVEEYNE